MKKLLTVKETAEILGLEISTIYDWVHYKKIAYIKIGRLLKFDPLVVEEFIKSHTVKGES